MSIEQLESDLKAVANAVPTGPLTSAAELGSYIKNNLVPLIAATVEEVKEMDDTIGDLVTRSADVLHEDTAQVFGGLIFSGLVLLKELEQRAAGDRAILAQIKEWRALAEQGSAILDDITIPDDEDDEDPAESTVATTEPGEGAKA
jgi:hypothetical protein